MLGWTNVARLIALMTLVGGASVSAMERLLTIGGGYSSSGNQVSFEKNVIYYVRIPPGLGWRSNRITCGFLTEMTRHQICKCKVRCVGGSRIGSPSPGRMSCD